jgi:hypothetical protein
MFSLAPNNVPEAMFQKVLGLNLSWGTDNLSLEFFMVSFFPEKF